MEKNGLKRDHFQEREKNFLQKRNRFALLAETEEREEYNLALQDMIQLLREAAKDCDVMHAIRLERQCIALDQSRRPDKVNELNQQLLKSSAAERGSQSLCRRNPAHPLRRCPDKVRGVRATKESGKNTKRPRKIKRLAAG